MSSKKSQSQSKKAAKLRIKKPKVTVKTGTARREAEAQKNSTPPTLWTIVIRLLPVWVLLIIIMLIEPTLPFRAVGSVVRWAGGLFPERQPASQSSDSVFIVEEASVADVDEEEIPPPDWDLDIARFFMPTVQYWADDIAAWSVAYRIKPNMIATIMQIESCGHPEAISGADALGLFQVLRPYFAEGEDPFDPDTNAARAMFIVEELLATINGDAGLMFAAYNGGAPILFVSPAQWPEETQMYQYWASGIYEEAERNLKQSPTLEEWLEAGGRSLCDEAAGRLGLDDE